MSKLKILCFHGYRQNADYFRKKTGSLRKVLKNYALFDFVSAPHVPIVSEDTDESVDALDERGELRAWWFSRADETFSSKDVTDIDTGLQESVEAVVKLFKDQGPYDGIMGFSQGATFAVLLAALKTRKEIDVDFSFMILFSGFPSLCSKHSELMNTKLNGIYCLHVYGENDKVVDFHMSAKLISMFDVEKCEVVVHDGGHFVPPMGRYKSLVINFLSKVSQSSL